MWQIGIWERGDGLNELARAVAGGRAQIRSGDHPALLTGENYDLLVVSPRATSWAGASAICCRTVLLPGPAGPLARSLLADRAVSYGMNPKDTLTISSLEEHRICVAVQRELLRLDGSVVERQELVLPYGGGAPELVLARTGLQLLLGAYPEGADAPQLL